MERVRKYIDHMGLYAAALLTFATSVRILR